jgi:hypothetical protein
MGTVKHIGLIVGMTLVAFLFVVITIYGEDPLLDSLASTGPDISLDDWRQVFRQWATFGILVAWLAALLWYAMGQWSFSLNSWAKSGKRTIWLLMLLLPLGAWVTGFLLTPPVQEGALWAYVFYMVNNLAVYYLATLWFSPSSFKYTPILAMTLRRW